MAGYAFGLRTVSGGTRRSLSPPKRDQLKSGRLTVYVDTSALDRQMEAARSITSMAAVAVLVAGSLVGSAGASNIFTADDNQRLADASHFAYVASLGVAALLVANYLWRLVRPRRRR